MVQDSEKLLNRDDVLRMIETHGGTAEGLDLSGKRFEQMINLSGLDLRGIILKNAEFWVDPDLEKEEGARPAYIERTNLARAHLEGAQLQYATFRQSNLYGAHLRGTILDGASLCEVSLRGADLAGASLVGSYLEATDLSGANLDRCNLFGARLQGVRLYRARLSFDTDLRNVDWGNYILAEERQGEFEGAEEVYRRLKIWHTNAGAYPIAGEFYYREIEAKRKHIRREIEVQFRLSRRYRIVGLSGIRKLGTKLRMIMNFLPFAIKKKVLVDLFALSLYRLICGYGEKPWRVVISAAVVVVGLALIYYAIGALTPSDFVNSLYYSAVSFTALGYGTGPRRQQVGHKAWVHLKLS